MLAPNPIHHGPRHFLTVFSLPALPSRIGVPEYTLIIPPIMYPHPRDSPENADVVRQLPE
jgi:hypothetical protein